MVIQRGTLLGRYEIRSLLGTEGMGEVYLAYDRAELSVRYVGRWDKEEGLADANDPRNDTNQHEILLVLFRALP